MKNMIIKPVRCISGTIRVPGDKSISHRALMAGAIADGVSRISNLLDCEDCNSTLNALRHMGITVRQKAGETVVSGKGLFGLKKPQAALYVGESGTTMRVLTGILAGQRFDSTIKGAPSLERRPMGRVTEPLRLMGAHIDSAAGGYPPLKILGSELKPISYKMPVASAQVKSAILFAGLYADGVTTVEENIKSRDHTERMLKYFGADVRMIGNKVLVKGIGQLRPSIVNIPGDISSASYFIAAGILLGGSRVRIKEVGINPARAGILDVLTKMGASISITGKKNDYEPYADVSVKGARTKGVTITEDRIPSIIDELPVIFVIAALSRGVTIIRGAAELRIKETDRIFSMTDNLRRMGSEINARGDDIVINGVKGLRGCRIKSYGDHRTCMAMTIAALAAEGESTIDDTDCVDKSFPGFFKALRKAGV